ncbi:MAG: glycosyltransferase family 87 protein [Anaerolineae bacterium]|nr:glycosyltransferase family 87 protein [Anaerolineae bacterium]
MGPEHQPVPRSIRWLLIFYLAIALGYLGLLMVAARSRLLWRMDFTNSYTGGTIVRLGLGAHLYDLALQTRVQQAILGPGRRFADGLLPFNNPPHFALMIVPLSLLPLEAAFGCWTAFQFGMAGWITYRLLALTARWTPTERRVIVHAFWAFPPLGITILHGQSSLFVFLCLMEWAWALKEGKDFQAGIWLTLAAVKPQAALFPALVLLGGRRWRALAGASAAGLLIIAGTAALLGPTIWPDYLRWLATTSGYFDRFGVHPQVMYNLKGTLTLFLGAERASLIQGVSMGALATGAVVVLALWTRSRWVPGEPEFDLRLALTLVLGALLSPHQYPHDSLVLLLPGVLFYDARRRVGRPTRAVAVFLLSWPVLFLLEELVLQGALGIRLPVGLMGVLTGWTSYWSYCRAESAIRDASCHSSPGRE